MHRNLARSVVPFFNSAARNLFSVQLSRSTQTDFPATPAAHTRVIICALSFCHFCFAFCHAPQFLINWREFMYLPRVIAAPHKKLKSINKRVWFWEESPAERSSTTNSSIKHTKRIVWGMGTGMRMVLGWGFNGKMRRRQTTNAFLWHSAIRRGNRKWAWPCLPEAFCNNLCAFYLNFDIQASISEP